MKESLLQYLKLQRKKLIAQYETYLKINPKMSKDKWEEKIKKWDDWIDYIESDQGTMQHQENEFFSDDDLDNRDWPDHEQIAEMEQQEALLSDLNDDGISGTCVCKYR